MMQEWIVGLLVLGAVVFVVRRFVFKPKSSSACGSCRGCSGKDGSCH